MKSSTQVIGLPLISIKEGLECGVIQDISVDTQRKKIKSLIVRGSKNDYDFRELNIEDVVGIGKDYVITQSTESTTGINLANPGASLLKVKCIASSGDVLGSINEFAFNEKTGEIQSLQIEGGLEVKGTNILSFSNDLLFVSCEEKKADAFAPQTADKKDASSLVKEQKEYLLGRTVKNDIKREDGTLIVKKGSQVTADTIFNAEKAGILVDLTLDVE